MTAKSNTTIHLSIKTLGDAVDYQQAVIKFCHKHYPLATKLIYGVLITGLTIGIRACVIQKTVKSNKIVPEGHAIFNVMPQLYADQKPKQFFRIDDKGELFVWEKSYGKMDSSFQAFKIQGRASILIINKQKSEATFLEDIGDLK